ncbi:MAG: hypothetical protein HXX13_08955 [Bacteroidetes bacterium]|nr:hypothetical protein [Bacteroidota bacterium]
MKILRTHIFNLLLLFILVSNLLCLTSCRKDKDASDEGVVAVFDTILSNTGSPVKVNYKDQIIVEIPAGSFPSGTKLTIKTIASGYLADNTTYDAESVFDVSLSSGSNFDPPLKITMPYQRDMQLPSFLQNKYMVGFYDENLRSWKPLKYSVVDSTKLTVSANTNHLTKLGRLSPKRAYGYDNFASSSHFYIYWAESKVPSISEYHSPNGFDFLQDPPYISDILFYLEASWDYFKSKDYPLTEGKIDVYIHNIGGSGSEGEFSPGWSLQGAININERIPADKGLTLQQQLPKTCAHEFMHYCQDYYYVWSVGKITMWWWEATASLADRLVFPLESPYEAEISANNFLTENITKSWDVFGPGDQSFYGSSGFLAYLAYYKPGNKIDINKVVKDGGEGALNFSTFLENYLLSIGCQKVGQEYRDYLKWVYENAGPIKLALATPTSTGTLPYASSFFAKGDMKTQNFKANVDYLSLRMIKFMGQDTASRKFKIKNNSESTDLECYVYLVCRKNGSESRILKKALNRNEEYVLDLTGQKEYYCDVIFINTSKDYAASYDCDITEVINVNYASISIGYGISYIMTNQSLNSSYTNVENENFYKLHLNWSGLSGNFYDLVGEDEVSGYVKISSTGDKVESFNIQVKNFYGQSNEYMVGYGMANMPGTMDDFAFHVNLSMGSELSYLTTKTGYAGPTQGYQLTDITALANWYLTLHK